MARENINDLLVFLAVARERSFTRAAAKLGLSQSALSHTVRSLETRLGLRLLTRTTRSVTPTEAGERLIDRVGPRIEEIEAEIAALGELRDKPAGTIRIAASDHAANTLLLPRLAKFLPEYPNIKVEVVVDYGLTDIFTERYDAAVRYGEHIAQDTIAVRLGPDIRMAVVATPAYFALHRKPILPSDLTAHNCINIRLPVYGGLYAWEFAKDGHSFNVHVNGQLIFNGVSQMLCAALADIGMAYVPENLVAADLACGRLLRVLEDWCPVIAGFYMYYPSKRLHSPAFALLIKALQYHARQGENTNA